MLQAIYNNEKINVDLFTQDDVYKGKALREMMMTTEAQTINNALDVAKHFGVPRLEVRVCTSFEVVCQKYVFITPLL